MMARDKSLLYANAQNCFLPKMDEYVAKKIGISDEEYGKELEQYKTYIVNRGKIEISYWEERIAEIHTYTREKAIEELIVAKKLNEKIGVIKSYLNKFEVQE